MNLRSLRNSGVEPETYGSLLVSFMKSKLPHELNLKLRRKFDKVSKVSKMSDIIEALCIELEALERIGNQKHKENLHNEERGNKSSKERYM